MISKPVYCGYYIHKNQLNAIYKLLKVVQLRRNINIDKWLISETTNKRLSVVSVPSRSATE